MDICAVLLLTLLMMLQIFTSFSDTPFEGYTDLCNRNLTALNELSKALETVSSNTVYIDLCSNRLTNLDSNTFSSYPDLERLVMSSNHDFQFPADGSPMLTSYSLTDFVCEQCGILKIFNRSLRELPILEYLVLSKNSISLVEKSAFRKNRRIKFVDLSGNVLRWIPSTMLIGLPEMETIDLSFNRDLAPAGHKPFLISNALEKLKCTGCGFTVIHESTFAKLTNLKEIYLEGNPVFQVQVSLSRAIGLLKQISNHRLHASSVGLHRIEDDLEINLKFDSEWNSEEEETIGKMQTSKPAVLVIHYKH